jgi:BolA protein
VSVPTANAARVERMRRLLAEAFAPSELEVIDDSHQHVGHAGAREGKGHFTVRIASAAFAGMTPLARHRAVYAALGDMMVDDIHALSIQATVPDPRAP